MKFDLKKLLSTAIFFAVMLVGTSAMAQTSCCTKEKEAEEACCTTTAKEETSGCTPSSCRGAQTKFGEAKVISNLRLSLIALKADMEKSVDPNFDERTYDLHGIIGESDDESLEIIIDEVILIEAAFVQNLGSEFTVFTLPENKAKQVKYLSERIEELKNIL